ncbi:aminopeptidase N-like [Macrobrachium nipponense]|uniref:aminopeptidase N-like n=1 Tax=Macrobrachium nipponense TaxID=159736 RepID=UPI0030C84DB7
MGKCEKKGCHLSRCCCFLHILYLFISTAAAGFFGLAFLYKNNAEMAPYTLTETVYFNINDVVPKEGTPMKEDIDYRLPEALKPFHYTLKLQPLIYGNRSVLGSVSIDFEVKAPASNITLHIAAIITKNETVKVVPSDNPLGPAIPITRQYYDPVRQFYIAELGSELESGKNYSISMEYEAYLSDELRGFYLSTYQSEAGEDRYLAVTQFEPTDARRAFPCFDEPAMKARFDVYLGRSESMTSISNMPLLETLPLEGQEGWYWDHFYLSEPMSTYLVALVVSDFDYIESPYGTDVLFRVWARHEAINQSDYALRKGPEVLSYYEKYFGVPYPLPKQDMIAVGDFAAGAMENWGLIVYRETAILLDPKVASARNKQRVMEVIAHELAHQWFGNLVTPIWWTDIWLNEGFANFMENYGSDHCEPTWKIMEQLIVDDIQNVFALDSLESSHPISIPVSNPEEIGQIFDDISYDKGSSIIRMMNSFLTEPTFMKAINWYLSTYMYKNADQDDLWDAMTKTAHEDGTLPRDMTVKKVMDTWTLQMGYPVINVTRSLDGTSATLTQERFLLVKNENSSDTHDYMWWVPLTYTNQDDPVFTSNQTVWMTDEEKEISIESLPSHDKWVIFNLQQIGYYRVNYDENNWYLLIQQLQTDHEVIHLINRAQIIDDALDLARAGHLSYNTALSVNSYLSKETEYVPWTAALTNMDYLESMFTRTGGYGALKNYLLDMLIPLYDSVGFDDDLDDPHLEQFKRVSAVSWVCKLGYEDCVTNSVNLYKAWMQNPTNHSIISPNQKRSVFCTAIANGGEEEWNFAFDQYQNSNFATEKDFLLSGMACTREIWILTRYLDLTFTEGSPIKRQDAARVYSDIARNEVGRDLAWDYMREQFAKVYSFFTSFSQLGDSISAVTEDFNTEMELQELIAFKNEHLDDLGQATRSVDQSIERVFTNIEWMNNYYDVIIQWLNDHGYPSRFMR